ncbi:hypothetical protein AB0J43_05400 [Nonomuraea fuscirosea]
MSDWEQVAYTLDQVATLLEGRTDLDADGAIRLVLTGNENTHIPDDSSDLANLYDDVTMALVSDHADIYLGRDCDPLNANEINAEEGANAAGVAASRVSDYVR